MPNQIEDTCESYKCYTCGEEYSHSPERCGCGNDWVGSWYDKLTFSVQVFRNPDTENEKPVYAGVLIADCHDSAREHEHELKKKYPHPQYEVVCDDVTDEEIQP